MIISDPTVVYRGLDFPTIERLATHLRAAGVDARVSVLDPQCAQTIPMFQTHHEVLATNFDTEDAIGCKEFLNHFYAWTYDTIGYRMKIPSP